MGKKSLMTGPRLLSKSVVELGVVLIPIGPPCLTALRHMLAGDGILNSTFAGVSGFGEPLSCCC